MDRLLSLLGLALRGGHLAVGEDPVQNAAEAHQARLILLASDAAGNTVRRTEQLAQAGSCLLARLPVEKERLGGALGRSSCAVAALTDIGLAEAAAKRLAALDEAQYGALAERLALKARRAAERREARKRGDRTARNGNKRNKRIKQ